MYLLEPSSVHRAFSSCILFPIFFSHFVLLPSPLLIPLITDITSAVYYKKLATLNTQEAQEANQAVTQSSGLKWTLNLKAFRAGNHVYGDSLYTESESKVSSTEPVEINRNEERFVESKVVITHAIAFDSRGMWLIFPCLYHHSISVGTLMCMLGNNSDWPR